MGLQDVVTLTRNGTSDEIIINEVRTSGTVYHLSGDEIVWLKQNGVHDCVIEAMQATAAAPPPVVYVNEPPPPPVVYVESRRRSARRRDHGRPAVVAQWSNATGGRIRPPVCFWGNVQCLTGEQTGGGTIKL